LGHSVSRVRKTLAATQSHASHHPWRIRAPGITLQRRERYSGLSQEEFRCEDPVLSTLKNKSNCVFCSRGRSHPRIFPCESRDLRKLQKQPAYFKSRDHQATHQRVPLADDSSEQTSLRKRVGLRSWASILASNCQNAKWKNLQGTKNRKGIEKKFRMTLIG
jgi:hypothetical protein